MYKCVLDKERATDFFKVKSIPAIIQSWGFVNSYATIDENLEIEFWHTANPNTEHLAWVKVEILTPAEISWVEGLITKGVLARPSLEVGEEK